MYSCTQGCVYVIVARACERVHAREGVRHKSHPERLPHESCLAEELAGRGARNARSAAAAATASARPPGSVGAYALGRFSYYNEGGKPPLAILREPAGSAGRPKCRTAGGHTPHSRMWCRRESSLPAQPQTQGPTPHQGGWTRADVDQAFKLVWVLNTQTYGERCLAKVKVSESSARTISGAPRTPKAAAAGRTASGAMTTTMIAMAFACGFVSANTSSK